MSKRNQTPSIEIESTCKPTFAPGVHLKLRRERLFDDDSIKLEHSFGYQCSEGINLCSLDKKKIIIAAGCYMMIFDVDDRSQSFFQTILGLGISKIVAHPNRKYFAVAEKAKKVRVYIYTYPDMKLYKTLNDDSTKGTCNLLQFQPKGDLLITISGHPENKLTLWKWKKEKEMLSSTASTWKVNDVSFSNVNPDIFSTCGRNQIKFWKIQKTEDGYSFEMTETKSLDDNESQTIQQCIHLPNEVFLAGAKDGYLLFWKGIFTELCLNERMGRKDEEPCHQAGISEILLMGDFLITVGMDGWVYLWSYKMVARRLRLMGEEEAKYLDIDPLDQIQVNETARLIHGVPALTEKMEKIWYIQDISGSIWQIDISAKRENNPPIEILKGPGPQITAMDTCKEYPLIAVCSKGGLISILDCTTRTEVCRKYLNTGATCLVWPEKEFDGKGASLLVGFEDGTLRWVVLVEGKEENQQLCLKCVYKPHSARVICMSLESTQTLLATYGDDNVLFFFSVIKQYELVPIGFYSMGTHMVKWMMWIKKPKAQKEQDVVDNQLETTEDTDTKEKKSEREEMISNLIEKEPNIVYETFDLTKFVEEETVFLPDSGIEGRGLITIKESDQSTISSEDGKLSDSSRSSSPCSSPYEEEKQSKSSGAFIAKKNFPPKSAKKQQPATKVQSDTEEKVIKTPVKSEVKSGKESEKSDGMKVEAALDIILIESLLISCKGSYLIEVDSPDQEYFEIVENRRTFHIPYDSIQIYKVGIFEPYHELGDRVYDSEDEEHPNRSELAKKHFRDLKYADKKTARRRKRREQPYGKPLAPPEVLGWLQSENIGHLWLSLGEYDHGYLFECAFVRDMDRNPVDLKPVRAIELLTSERTAVMSLCMSSCGEFIFLGQQDGKLSVCRLEQNFDISTGYDFVKYPLHDSAAGSIIHTKVTPNNEFVITAGLDGNIFLSSFNVPIIERGIDMKRPHSSMIRKVTDISDPCALTIEQALAKSIRLEIVDKVTNTLSELHVELPILKNQYNSLKIKYEVLNKAYLQLPAVSNFKMTLDISSVGGHPKCIAAFHKVTGHLMEQIGLKFKDAIAQWGSYLSKLKEAFEDSIEEPKLVKNFISDEIVQSYVECRLPRNKQTASHEAGVFEYEKYVSKKSEFVPNTHIMEKLDVMLNKTRHEVMHYPADMPLTENFIHYNNRKLEKLRRIMQRIRYEEENPRPLFDEEDDYFMKKRKEIENNYYRLKSDPDMKNRLPKGMKLSPQQKKAQIWSYLNKMHNLWQPYNREVAKLEKMLHSIEQWDLGLGEKETHHREEVTAKKTIETIKDVTDVIEAMLYSIVEYIELQTDVSLTEAESLAIANSHYEDYFPLDASNMEEVPETADNFEDIFNTEFCDDECYYTPTVPRYHPVAYSPSSSEDEEIDVSYPYNKSLDTYTNNTNKKQSADNLKTYEIEGITVYVATRKKRPLPNKILTNDYCLGNEAVLNKETKSLEMGSERTVLHRTNNEHKHQLSNTENEKENTFDWEQSWESLKVEIEAKCLRKPFFDFNSTSKNKSSARSQIQICPLTPKKEENYENNELEGHKYFFGIEQMIKEEEDYEEMQQATKQFEKRMMMWMYFNNFHHVMVILRYKMDCEKKYQDLVFNMQCRELNIIEHDYPEIHSCIERIREAEGDIKFECVKLELLEHMLGHASKEVEHLRLKSHELYQNFMDDLGENHKHNAFFSKFFQIKSKIKAHESEENAAQKQAPQDEEEEEEEVTKEDENQVDEDEQARTLKINATLYRNAKLTRQEMIKTEIEFNEQKKRIQRSENKKQFLMKRVKKLRGTIADIIPEIHRVQAIMKSKLDKQELHVLVYKKQIECNSLTPRTKDNFTLHRRNILAQLAVANNIIERALIDIEKAVIGSILRELGRVARTLISQYGTQKIKTKVSEHDEMLTEKDIGDTLIIPATETESKTFTTVVKPTDKEVGIQIKDIECGKPEAEGKIDIEGIINTGIRNYENYSKVIEGDYFLFPEYFMHAVSIKNQGDINTYQVVKKCMSQMIDNLETFLNDIPTISVNNVISDIIHTISTLTEAKAITETPAVLATETEPKSPFEESEPVNPGGSLLYEINVLTEMERKDPEQYKYTDLFHEFVEVSEVIKDRRESLDSFIEEENTHQFNLENFIKQYVVVSKGCIEDMEKMHQYLHTAFKLDGREHKKDSMYLSKLKTLNYFLEKSSVRRIRFQIKDNMTSKLGCELDLEMLLDTLENPNYHVTKHELEKKLVPLRRNVQIKQKAIAIQKIKKEKIVYAINLLWIECGHLQKELDIKDKNNLRKRKELVKKSREQKFRKFFK